MLSRAICLEALILGSLWDLGNLIYRGCRAYAALPLPTRTTLRAWVRTGVDSADLIDGLPLPHCGGTPFFCCSALSRPPGVGPIRH